MTRTPKTLLQTLLLLLVLSCAAGTKAQQTLGKNELPIHDAARLGNRATVERILKANPAMRDVATDAIGSTPLHLAALNPDSGPLQALIAAGANVNARDKNDATPLHMAAFGTQSSNARLLLEAGADPLLKTVEGRDVASVARRVRADEVAGIVSIWLLKGCKAGTKCL